MLIIILLQTRCQGVKWSSLVISDEKLAAEAKIHCDADTVLNWLELPDGEIYAITLVQERESSKHGTCWILSLMNRERK